MYESTPSSTPARCAASRSTAGICRKRRKANTKAENDKGMAVESGGRSRRVRISLACVDRIFRFLHPGDVLCDCGLVCRSWNRIAFHGEWVNSHPWLVKRDRSPSETAKRHAKLRIAVRVIIPRFLGWNLRPQCSERWRWLRSAQTTCSLPPEIVYFYSLCDGFANRMPTHSGVEFHRIQDFKV